MPGVTCRDCSYPRLPNMRPRAGFSSGQHKLVCFHQTTTNSPLPCPKCRGLNIKFLSGGLGNLSKEIKYSGLMRNLLTFKVMMKILA